MSEIREKMVDRMIQIYGFEHPIVLEFCRHCENENISDRFLNLLVSCHEEFPVLE